MVGSFASYAAARLRKKGAMVAPFFRFSFDESLGLEHVPQELVVDLVVELNLGSLHEGAELAGAAVGCGLL
jgi:hypothetical protein